MLRFYSSGKLLLSSEYLVVDGALALAVPTKKGQSMIVEKEGSHLIWNSYLEDNSLWFQAEINLVTWNVTKTTNSETSNYLLKVLQEAKNINSSFLLQGAKVETHLEFLQDWGLGSSSTFIHNVAQWASVNPFDLFFRVANGSGYDIACAQATSAILYQRKEIPKLEAIDFSPSFAEELFFVYLNIKQKSDKAVSNYKDLTKDVDLTPFITDANRITQAMCKAENISEFESLMQEHEYLLSHLLQRNTIKEELFPLYPRAIKSLGAWGGDFILVAARGEEINYFKERGYTTILPYYDMV